MTFPTALDYTPEQTALIHSATLTAATILGDYLEDLVVVGGLVPSLLIPAAELPSGAEPHVGTMDLDLGLDLAILESHRYEGIAERLRSAGFTPDLSEKGNETRQRLRFQAAPSVTIDFLMPAINGTAQPGRLQPLESGLAAIIIPALELAFQERIYVSLTGTTLFNETVTRNVPVCNPGAFVLLKALALRNRGKFKDAYDLYYMIRNYGAGPEEVAGFFRQYAATDPGREAIAILHEDFHSESSLGPNRVALFRDGTLNAELQADVVGFVGDFLRMVEQ